MLNDTVRGQLRDILGGLARDVEVELYGPAGDEGTEVMRSLLAEMREAVPALQVKESDSAPVLEPGHDTGMQVEGPVLTVRHPGAGGVRFVGLAVGLEFSSLVEAIRQAGSGESALAPDTLTALASLDGPVHIQVFTTPSCPYCPQAVRIAQEMAFASDRVVADMVDASTYQELAGKYRVMGVPAQYFNGRLSQVGLAPEAQVLSLVREAARLGAA